MRLVEATNITIIVFMTSENSKTALLIYDNSMRPRHYVKRSCCERELLWLLMVNNTIKSISLCSKAKN